jgi:hypothetical protein
MNDGYFFVERNTAHKDGSRSQEYAARPTRAAKGHDRRLCSDTSIES